VGVEKVVDRIILATGQYAKRQDTWFRKEKVEVWFDMEETSLRQVIDHLA
jgi:tRNA A37 N6-isopentenylltransferase MiaA